MTTATNIQEIPAGLNMGELREAISEEYSQVADTPNKGFHFHTGRKLATLLNYDQSWLKNVPEASIESFAGTGNPFSLGAIKEGYNVLDIGSGAGIDSLIAASKVGPSGSVIGIDMTDSMLNKARASARAAGATNIEFVKSQAESLPLPDNYIDVVISNGVLNLIPDKFGVLSEMFRVLKPGGRLQIADIILEKAVSNSAKSIVSLWSGCIAGGLLEEELEEFVTRAGFVDFEITWSAEVFDGAPQASNAAAYGTKGITFRAIKPEA